MHTDIENGMITLTARTHADRIALKLLAKPLFDAVLDEQHPPQSTARMYRWALRELVNALEPSVSILARVVPGYSYAADLCKGARSLFAADRRQQPAHSCMLQGFRADRNRDL